MCERLHTIWKECPHLPITETLILSTVETRLDCEVSLTQSTVIAWIFTRRTGSVELDSAYTTDIILWHIPSPRGHGVPFFDGDFHGVMCCLVEGRLESQ